MKDERTIFELMSDVQKLFDVAGRELARHVFRVNRVINRVFSGKKTESGGPTLDQTLQTSDRMKSYPSWEEGLKWKERALRLERGIEDVQIIVDQSRGVDGWHQNGDIASWEELMHGQRSVMDFILECGDESNVSHETSGGSR